MDNLHQIPVKTALAVQKYHHPGQTFVNRHARALFGGNSAIISERHYRDAPVDQPNPAFFITDHLFNFRDIVAMPYMAYRNNKLHHAFRIPYGQHRAALISFLKAQGAQAILSEFGSQSMLVSDIGKEMGLPVFCYFRGRDSSYWLNSKKRVAAYKKVFESLAGVFAVSQFLLDNLAANGLTHPNSHVVPSGTDIERFAPKEKTPRQIIAVGRFVEKKQPLLAIRSFIEVAGKYPDARLEMIGGGPLLRSCQEYVAQSGFSDQITLHGQKSSAFIAERLAKASVFIQHSVTDAKGEAEGLPSSIQEAMASGCAIVSTNHAGIPELIEEGVTGYLSNEHDYAAFTAALARTIDDPEQTAKMGKAARLVAEERIDYRKLYVKVERVIRAAV